MQAPSKRTVKELESQLFFGLLKQTAQQPEMHPSNLRSSAKSANVPKVPKVPKVLLQCENHCIHCSGGALLCIRCIPDLVNQSVAQSVAQKPCTLFSFPPWNGGNDSETKIVHVVDQHRSLLNIAATRLKCTRRNASIDPPSTSGRHRLSCYSC